MPLPWAIPIAHSHLFQVLKAHRLFCDGRTLVRRILFRAPLFDPLLLPSWTPLLLFSNDPVYSLVPSLHVFYSANWSSFMRMPFVPNSIHVFSLAFLFFPMHCSFPFVQDNPLDLACYSLCFLRFKRLLTLLFDVAGARRAPESPGTTFFETHAGMSFETYCDRSRLSPGATAAALGLRASRIPFQVLAALELLGGFSSKEAKQRPAVVLLLGLLAGFCGSYVLPNVSSVWLAFFAAHLVFAIVWILSEFVPESPVRTVVVGMFDSGCAVSTFMLGREVLDSQSLSAWSIWLCGFFQIIHIVFLGAVLTFGLCRLALLTGSWPRIR